MSTICTCKGRHLHGSTRSLVRRIGSSLPIDTRRRLQVQLAAESPMREEANLRYTERLNPSLEGLTLASYLKEPGQIISKAVNLFGLEPIQEEGENNTQEEDTFFESSDLESDALEEEDMEESLGEGENKQETMQKISALESELARLKAQIAIYALSETQEQHDIPAAPAPPTAPPPPPLSAVQPKAPHVSQYSTPLRQDVQFATPKPDMSSVLKDIGSVRLRSVARSPGGTPLRRVQESQDAAANDPGAIIAQALRKKFSHKVFQDSPGEKENLNRSDSSLSAGFDSPSVKLFD